MINFMEIKIPPQDLRLENIHTKKKKKKKSFETTQ